MYSEYRERFFRTAKREFVFVASTMLLFIIASILLYKGNRQQNSFFKNLGLIFGMFSFLLTARNCYCGTRILIEANRIKRGRRLIGEHPERLDMAIIIPLIQAELRQRNITIQDVLNNDELRREVITAVEDILYQRNIDNIAVHRPQIEEAAMRELCQLGREHGCNFCGFSL